MTSHVRDAPSYGCKNVTTPSMTSRKHAAGNQCCKHLTGIDQFIMQMDASGYALGVIIQQEHKDSLHPIAFHSRSFLPAEQNYNIHDKELAGVIFGFKCAWPLFLGAKHPVIMQTDHKNLQYFREPQKISRWQAVRVGDPTSAQAGGCRSLLRCIAPLLPDPGKPWQRPSRTGRMIPTPRDLSKGWIDIPMT